MKKPRTVIEAEASLKAKAAELTQANEALKRLGAEYSAAYAAVRKAQTDADANQPQCRLVRVKWNSGNEEDAGRVVIMRRTPGGMLVVRHVGDPQGNEYKFKFGEHSRRFKQAEKAAWTSDTRELRDVPAEYLPQP